MCQKRTILIADDDRTNRLLIRHILRKQPYSLVEASSGNEALELTSSKHVDVVILDVVMDDLDGFSVCKQLRKRYSKTEMPVLFVTAQDEDSQLAEGFSAGGNDYVTKPISDVELLARIQAQVHLIEQSQALSKSYELLASKKQVQTIGTFAVGIFHNYNNILGTILGNAELIEIYARGNRDIKESAKTIIEAVERGISLNKHLQFFLRTEKRHRCENISELIQSVLALIDSSLKPDCSIKLSEGKKIPSLPISPQEFSQIVIELLKNSLAVTPVDGEIEISSTLEVDEDGQSHAVIRVTDNGSGIAPEIESRVFEPFFSTSESCARFGIGLGGSGLGLSAARTIAESANGTLRIAQTGVEGTTMELKIPIK